jgi:3'-phosphoadenosine 5'-phosphosulfate sulfotransferase (PAPS reductase)/FAD synthetase
MERRELIMLQSLPLEVKIKKSLLRIEEWYRHFDGKVYVAFSGGLDSTVLLHLVRSIYPEVVGVYCDTGLEFPENRNFVKTIENIVWLKPKINFTEVIKRYGYPVVSKEQSQFISQLRNAKSEKTKITRIIGNKWGRGKISDKHKYLINAPFKISDKCCDIMKKNPSKKFEKENDLHPFIGKTAEESEKRLQDYLKTGCNAFNAKRPTSNPLGFWTKKDIKEYIKKYNLNYSKLYDMGYERSGCVFCLYGIDQEKGENRIQRLSKTHPQLYNYCLNKLGLKEILEYMDIPYEPQISMFDLMEGLK